MSELRAQRRLAAIVAVDVAGYSRLIGADDEGTLARLNAHRRELIDPKVAERHGRIVKTTGDGFLIEFVSAVDAVHCAIDVQHGMSTRNATVPEPDRIRFRIGINIGDIIVESGDIFGDGVNVAARLENIAEPGTIYISRQVYDQLGPKFRLLFHELGPRNLKNIAKAVDVFATDIADREDAVGPRAVDLTNQEINYCRTPDGVRLAYARVGNGPPIVKSANWMNHLEYDWESPIWRHFLRNLAKNHTLIRYDARGNGLSDWDVGELSLDAWVSDLETVVDAAHVDRFPLLGISQGCAVSIAYAVRHPERVTHLILYGGFALGGKKRSPEERERRTAMLTLMRLGWGMDNPTFRQLFTSLFIPGATKEQADWFNELQRRTTSPECAARYFDSVGDIDVTNLLPKVKAPTLVMHVRGDLTAPFEFGQKMAAGIKSARFVALQGQNHLFLEHEPASDRFFEEINLFLKQ